MCMLTLGTGVGGGIVLGGRIWRGMTGMAAELGHIMIDPDGPDCGCGSHGCVEQFASATAILRMAREAIASGEAPELARAFSVDPEFSARAVHNLALQGDKQAKAIFDRVGPALGVLLADLVNA
jgi:glucokinase